MSDTTSLHMRRFIRAPRERVFDAFVQPDVFARWMCPRGMRADKVRLDARPQGAWYAEMVARDGSRFCVGGQYELLDRPQRIIYSWEWQGEQHPLHGVKTQVDVQFTERDGGTELAMVHSGFVGAPMRAGHERGWQSTLNKLNDVLDPQGTAGTVTLLGSPRSTYVRSVRMAFAEKGIAVALVPASPHSPEVNAVHPFGRIPALRDGDITVFETSAILHYIDESFGDTTLWRASSIADRTRDAQWVSAIHSYLYPTMVTRYVIPHATAQREGRAPDAAVIDKSLQEMPAQLAALEQAHEGRAWLGGDNVAQADLLLAPIVAYLQGFDATRALLARCPNILRAHSAMAARPSFQTTLPTQP
jgi:glutathione S-transferase